MDANYTGPQIVKKGYLTKKGEWVWSKRYFILVSDGTLRYFAAQKQYEAKAEPRNSLDLFGGAVLYAVAPKVPPERAVKPCIEVNTPRETIFIHGEDKEETHQWYLLLKKTCEMRTLQVAKGIISSHHYDALLPRKQTSHDQEKAEKAREFLRQSSAEHEDPQEKARKARELLNKT